MKRKTIAFLLTLILGLWISIPALGQPKTELFDARKSAKDLEVMKGILRTTLNFAVTEMNPGEAYSRQLGSTYFGASNIQAFYLYGQGAVFLLPASSFFGSHDHFSYAGEDYVLAGKVYNDMAVARKMAAEAALSAQELKNIQEELRRGMEEGTRRTPPPPPAPPYPPGEPPAPPSPPAVVAQPTQPAQPAQSAPTVQPKAVVVKPDARMKEKLATLQERSQKEKETQEKRREKYREIVGKLKGQLIEALSSHGDSLTQVKPNEYVTLVIGSESSSLGYPQFLSIQKSIISDYKAGRLTYDAFKAKVLDYTN